MIYQPILKKAGIRRDRSVKDAEHKLSKVQGARARGRRGGSIEKQQLKQDAGITAAKFKIYCITIIYTRLIISAIGIVPSNLHKAIKKLEVP